MFNLLSDHCINVRLNSENQTILSLPEVLAQISSKEIKYFTNLQCNKIYLNPFVKMLINNANKLYVHNLVTFLVYNQNY